MQRLAEGLPCTGTLRFTAPSTFAQLYIAPLLPEFLRLYPGIRLDLRLTDAQVPIIEGSLIRVLPDYTADDDSVLWLVYPKSNVLTAKVRVFIDFLMDRIGHSPVWE